MTAEVTLGGLESRGILSIGDGYRTKRSEHGAPGFRILRVADIADGIAALTGPDFVSVDFRRQIGAKLSRPGDVLLTTKGTVGRVARMPSVSETVVYSPQLCFFRVMDNEKLDARFLEFWFRSDRFLEQAAHRSNNTDMAAYINLTDIRSLQMELPELGAQQAIAEVLGALDDKIAANAQLISTADEVASLRFQALVVEDDAVPAPLSMLAEFVNGKAFTKNASGTGRVVVRIAELNSGIGGSTVYNDIEVDDRHVTRPGDLLFAWSGSLTVHRWYRPEAIINQHIFKVIPRDVPMWVVRGALGRKLAEFKSIAADRATTMGHIQRHHLDEIVLVPSCERIGEMDGLMTSLWDRALAAEQESLRLVATRDALLPLLMSGKVRVEDAARSVSESV